MEILLHVLGSTLMHSKCCTLLRAEFSVLPLLLVYALNAVLFLVVAYSPVRALLPLIAPAPHRDTVQLAAEAHYLPALRRVTLAVASDRETPLLSLILQLGINRSDRVTVIWCREIISERIPAPALVHPQNVFLALHPVVFAVLQTIPLILVVVDVE